MSDLRERGKAAKADNSIIDLALCVAELGYIKKDNFANIANNYWNISIDDATKLRKIGNCGPIVDNKKSMPNDIEVLFMLTEKTNNQIENDIASGLINKTVQAVDLEEPEKEKEEKSELTGDSKTRLSKGTCLRLMIDGDSTGAYKLWEKELSNIKPKQLDELKTRMKAEDAFEKFGVMHLDQITKEVVDAICDVAIKKQKSAENKSIMEEWRKDIYAWRKF